MRSGCRCSHTASALRRHGHEGQHQDRPLRRVLDDRHRRPSCMDLRQRKLRTTPNWFGAHPMRLATKATPIPFATDPGEYPEPLRCICEGRRTASLHIRTPIRRIRSRRWVRPLRYIFDELLLLLVRPLPNELRRWYNVPNGRNTATKQKGNSTCITKCLRTERTGWATP